MGGALACGGGRGVRQGHAALKAPARFFTVKIFSFMGCLGFRVCNFCEKFSDSKLVHTRQT